MLIIVQWGFFMLASEISSMSFDIRPATTDDIQAIQEVATDAWHAAHAPIIGADTVDSFLDSYYDRASFRERIQAESMILDVATDGQTDIVGYVLASRSEEGADIFNLSHIYVDPDRWGEGIGQQLLSHVETKIQTRGGRHLKLGVMAPNERAIKFYEQSGYEKTDKFYDDRIDVHGYTYRKNLG
ncbi:MAG: N-acetyltransferase family protein [Halobacteriaceae archaeon]